MQSIISILPSNFFSIFFSIFPSLTQSKSLWSNGFLFFISYPRVWCLSELRRRHQERPGLTSLSFLVSKRHYDLHTWRQAGEERLVPWLWVSWLMEIYHRCKSRRCCCLAELFSLRLVPERAPNNTKLSRHRPSVSSAHLLRSRSFKCEKPDWSSRRTLQKAWWKISWEGSCMEDGSYRCQQPIPPGFT